MKIYPLASLKNDWYPKQSFDTFNRYSRIEFVNSAVEADVIWIYTYYLSPSSILRLDSNIFYNILHRIPFLKNVNNKFAISSKYLFRQRSFKDKLVISTIHHLDPDKSYEWYKHIKVLDKISDIVQFFSNPNIDANKQFLSSPVIKMPYWIDNQTFFPLEKEDKQKIKESLDLPKDKKIIGSFQRDTESDGKSPKLSKGPDVFCDIIEKLDKNKYFVLLSGPRREYIEKRLSSSNIEFRSLGQIEPKEMNNLYNILDNYLVTSRIEGGPQAILECMATKTPIFSSPVGIYDILDSSTIKYSVDDFVDSLNETYPDVIEKNFNTSRNFVCEEVIDKWDLFFDEALKLHKERKNLRNLKSKFEIYE